MSDYHTKSIADLKAILSSRGLKTTGTKSVLIQRLEENDATESVPSTESATTATGTKGTTLDSTNSYSKPTKITLENIGQMSLEERIEARRKRFGTDTLSYKLEQRKNRFGIVAPNSNKIYTSNNNVESNRKIVIS